MSSKLLKHNIVTVLHQHGTYMETFGVHDLVPHA